MPKLKRDLNVSKKKKTTTNPNKVVKVREKKTVPFTRANNVKVKRPTSRGTWKLFERNVAKDFETNRTPGSGGIRTLTTSSDTLHEFLYIECKLRDKFSIITLYLDTLEKAKLEGKIPFVALKQKGIIAKGEVEYLILCDPKHLNEISKHYNGRKK